MEDLDNGDGHQLLIGYIDILFIINVNFLCK